MNSRVLVVVFSLVWAGLEASNVTTSGASWSVVLRVFENCADEKDSLKCLQQKILNFANRAVEAKSLDIFDGVKFVRDETSSGIVAEQRSSPSQENNLSDDILRKVGMFFETHSAEVNLPKFLRADDEARKKKGGFGGIILLAGAIKGAMMYMGMQAIAALAGKALIVAKIALTVASVIALKKLLEGSSGKTSYEIVKHPQHTYVQTHSSSHEYGGHGGHGGHGGGYEGHYRKRSISRGKVDDDHESGTLQILAATTDASRHLPKPVRADEERNSKDGRKLEKYETIQHREYLSREDRSKGGKFLDASEKIIDASPEASWTKNERTNEELLSKILRPKRLALMKL